MTTRSGLRLSACACAVLVTACVWGAGGGAALYCGGERCEWELEAGETEPIDTWSTWEDGLALVGAPVRLSLTHRPLDGWPDESAEAPSCYFFAATLDVEPGTETRFLVDVHADGTVDESFPLSKTGWTRVTRTLRMPDHYEEVRFAVEKREKGKAHIALLRVEDRSWQGCSGPAIELEPQNEGAACRKGSDCRSDVCAGGYCSDCAGAGTCQRGDGCSVDAHCAEGFACAGLTCTACAARGDCPLGSACGEGDHCETGICAGGLCSVCEDDDDCQPGAECVPSVEPVEDFGGIREVPSALVCAER